MLLPSPRYPGPRERSTIESEPIRSLPHLALGIPPEAVVHHIPRRPGHLSSPRMNDSHDLFGSLLLCPRCLLRWYFEAGPNEHAEDVALIRPVPHVYEDRSLGCPIPPPLLYRPWASAS